MKINDSGRPMIEMLGVLAISVILSVGGIKGFNNAMTGHKLNKLSEEHSVFLQNIHQDTIKLCKTNTTGSYQSISKYLNALDIIPAKWKYNKYTGEIYDSIGFKIAAYTANSTTIAINYSIPKDVKEKEQICRKIWTSTLVPLAGIFYQIRMLSGGVVTIRTYGENYCNEKNQDCISKLTISNIKDICQSCGNQWCYIDIYIK